MRRQSSFHEFDKSCVRAQMQERYPLTRGLATYDTVRRYAQILSAMIIMSLPWATSRPGNNVLSNPDFLLKVKKMQENTTEVLWAVALPVVKTQ